MTVIIPQRIIKVIKSIKSIKGIRVIKIRHNNTIRVDCFTG